GVVKLEYGVAIEQLLAGGKRAFEHAHAVLERLGKSFLLLPQNLGRSFHRAAQLRVGVTHRPVQVRHQAVEEGLLLAELVAVADRAPNDPAQDIASALVARDHAIDNEEG